MMRGKMENQVKDVECFHAENLKLEIYPTSRAAGEAAAQAAAKILKQLAQEQESIG
ncbi:MAG: hypothetical protein WCE63_23800 [Acidobacteriaceae bacterium]